jgi:hypothetical protein
MVGRHGTAEVRGGEVLGLGMPRKPLAAEAVGHPREHGVQAQGLGVAQAAAVVLTRGVEPGVEAGFNPPMLDVGLQPLLREEFGGRAAGDETDGFGLAPCALTVQPGDLPGAGKEQFLAGDGGADDPARYPLAFLFLSLVPGAAARVLCGDKRGEPGSGSFDSIRFLISGVLSLMVRA